MSLSRSVRFALLALSVAAVGACTVKDTPAPPLSGPSEMAIGLHMQVVPDAIPQDGVSQSAVTIEALGPDGRAVRALSVRLDIVVNGTPVDFGRLSSKTVVTGDDGKARVTYTAPPKPFESTGLGTEVSIMAVPIGTDYGGATGRSVSIRLYPPGIIMPPNGAPVAAMTVTPTPVSVFSQTTFDASGTTDEGVACGAACRYSWSFGDGGSAEGMVVNHEFRSSGTFTVRLTVTDARGQVGVTTQTVTVGAGSAPTAAFTFSPAEPLPGQMIFFNASASQAAEGRRIVSYEWDFGSGRTGSGVTVSKGYDTPSTYVVTLTVTDDANQVGVTSQEVAVGTSTSAGAGAGGPHE